MLILLLVLGILSLVIIAGLVAIPSVRRSRSAEPQRSTRQVTDTTEHPGT